jgi:nitric oxide reductase large subunit
MLARPPILLRRSPVAGDVASGFLGGLFGGFAATPGAPVSIWCGMKGWDKVGQRAVFQPFILIAQFIALVWIVMMHAHAAQPVGVPSSVWACVPAGLVGTRWGLNYFRRMTDRQFAIAINLVG